jgi:LacI family transcriptional regulator
METPSVRDVARRAKVSLGTVSNVLNRPELVRPHTRARVLQAIEDLGFVRNESARSLRSGGSRLIAYLMLDQTNPFFADLGRGMEDVARRHGLGLILCSSDHDAAREDDYLSMLVEQRIHGLLITAVNYDNPRLALMSRHRVPVVFVDGPGDRTDRCTVSVDDVEGGDLAASHLVEQGHRKIAFVGGPTSIPQVADRLQGARNGLAAAGLDPDALVVMGTDELNVAEGRRAGARLLGMPARRRPTAAFCANDLLALGLLQEMTLRGVTLPAEMSIVGYDDIDFAAAAAIPLTSVRQPRRLLGSTAAELLIDEAQTGDDHRHRHIQFPPELIVRASTQARGARLRARTG